ncbi:MAG: molybdopterin-dependent oxidoreductase, partial [Ectothiorhodospiraceae bacterium]|nr:molybdopterin-dependent oxidoreductase [Ectothiorhodospiraceae bacterium]
LIGVLADCESQPLHAEMVERLRAREHALILLGPSAFAHPQFTILRALASALAQMTGAAFGYLPEAGNSAGAWLAGAVPHRVPAGRAVERRGLDARAMLAQPRKAYLLIGVEPVFDCADPAQAIRALAQAECVIALTPFAGETLREQAHVLLPVAAFAETSGTFVNLEGRWQGFKGAGRAPGEARPGWKVLRVLGNLLDLPGFEHVSSEQVRDELKGQLSDDIRFDNAVVPKRDLHMPPAPSGLTRVATVPMYAGDMLQRRVPAFEAAAGAVYAAAYVNASEAERQGLAGCEQVFVRQGEATAELPLVIDPSVPDACVWIPAGLEQTRTLGANGATVELQKTV